MKHYKNFVQYIPKDGDVGVRYLKDSLDRDWYDLKETFKEDTLKVLYDEDGIIYTIDVNHHFMDPEGHSILEIPFDKKYGQVQGVQWVLEDGKVVPSKEWAKDIITNIRREILGATDFLMSPDYELDVELKFELVRYRTELRNLSETEGYPLVKIPTTTLDILKHVDKTLETIKYWNKTIDIINK